MQPSESGAPATSRSTPQNQSELRLIPYVEYNGARTLPDSFLEDVFTEMIIEGLVSTVFVGTDVTNSEEFIKLMKSPGNVAVFVLDGEKCITFAWLNSIGLNYAYGHFCFFQNDRFSAIEVGKKILEYWWSLGSTRKALDVILGSIPSFNTRAIAFMEKLGAVRLGQIPNLFFNPFTGEKWPSVIFYCLRP